jgi:uncharacterized protein
MKIEELVKRLELLPHPEGGFYREIYRSEEKIPGIGLPDRFFGDRNFATGIYFLIEKNNFSALHRIKSDEIWHFYEGDALEVIEIDLKGNLISTVVGRDLNKGEVFQYTVKAGHWFGSRVKAGGNFSLVGCTVAPGFDFQDFEMAGRLKLISEYPQHRDMVEQLTRY